jgi:hypothetical protein
MSTDATDAPVPAELPEILPEETLQFDYPGSDIVFRSCDSHNFHAIKLYISNSSPVLRELMRSVSNISDVANGEEPEPLPVVELPETGVTLHSLLTLIFPVVPILPSTSDKIMELLAVAQKYQMDSVLSHIRCIIGARKDPAIHPPRNGIPHLFLCTEAWTLSRGTSGCASHIAPADGHRGVGRRTRFPLQDGRLSSGALEVSRACSS